MSLDSERWGWYHWAAALGAGLVPLVYLFSIDEVLGAWGDDAWYLVLGKSLATGQGFRAISLPFPPAVPFYPPGFPALLAAVWKACPSVSPNAVCFKLVPILFSLGFSVLSYLVLRTTYKTRPVLVAMVVVASGLHPYLASYLGSAVMSDMPYAFLSMLIILLVEGYAKRPLVSWWLAVSAILLASLFLVRYVGFTLILASGVYLLIMRQPGKTLSLWGGTMVLLAPWLYLMWTGAGGGDLMEAKGWRSYGHHLSAVVGNLGVWGYLNFLVFNITHYLRMFVPTVVLPVSAWILAFGSRWTGPTVLVGALDVLGIAVAVTVVLGCVMRPRPLVNAKNPRLLELYILCYILVLISQPVYSPRYLLPLAPFITFYLFCGIRRMALWILHLKWHDSARVPALASLITAVVMLGIGSSHLLIDAYRVYNLRWRPSSYYTQWPEILEAYRWIRSRTPPETVVAAPNPAQVYLYTDRRAIYLPQSQGELHARQVGYVLNGAPSPSWLSEQASLFQRVFTSTGGTVGVFRVKG